MTMPAQLSFDGREVAGAVFKFGQTGLDTLPEGLTWEDVAALHIGDRLEVKAVYVVTASGGSEKIDADNGIGTGGPVRTFSFSPVREGFEVKALLKREDIEELWKQAHA